MNQIRAMTCACGHKVVVETEENAEIKLGEKLFTLVRDHVDQIHADLNLSNRDIWVMLAEKAYTPSRPS